MHICKLCTRLQPARSPPVSCTPVEGSTCLLTDGVAQAQSMASNTEPLHNLPGPQATRTWFVLPASTASTTPGGQLRPALTATSPGVA